MSRFRMWAEYVGLRVLTALFRIMPVAWGMRAAWWLGRLAFSIDRRHRPEAYDNLEKAFRGTISLEEMRRITLENYVHMMRCVVDMVHLPRLYRNGSIWKHVEMKGLDHVKEAVAAGKGGIFVTGHIGNWELLGWVFAAMGYKCNSLARPLDNPLLDAYVKNVREMTGQKIIPKKGALRRLARVLKEGGYVAFLIDQDARRKGIFVEFFGRMASTTPSVAALALRTGAPIVVGWSRRIGTGLRYELIATPTIWAKPSGNKDEDIRSITAEMTRRLESFVRECPEQWLWLHRRWKTRPAEELAAAVKEGEVEQRGEADTG